MTSHVKENFTRFVRPMTTLEFKRTMDFLQIVLNNVNGSKKDILVNADDQRRRRHEVGDFLADVLEFVRYGDTGDGGSDANDNGMADAEIAANDDEEEEEDKENSKLQREKRSDEMAIGDFLQMACVDYQQKPRAIYEFYVNSGSSSKTSPLASNKQPTATTTKATPAPVQRPHLAHITQFVMQQQQPGPSLSVSNDDEDDDAEEFGAVMSSCGASAEDNNSSEYYNNNSGNESSSAALVAAAVTQHGCLVCGDLKRYGRQLVCKACLDFFRNCVTTNWLTRMEQEAAACAGQCPILLETRRSACKRCRFERCVEAGLNAELVGTIRPRSISNGKNNLLQQQPQQDE